MFFVLFHIIWVMHSIIQVKIRPSHFLVEFIYRRSKELQLGVIIFEFSFSVDGKMTNFFRSVKLSKR